MKDAKKAFVQDRNSSKINNPEIKLEQDIITSGYNDTEPIIVKEYILNNTKIKLEGSIIKRETQQDNETRKLNNPEINNHNVKENIITSGHNNKKLNEPEFNHAGTNVQRHSPTEDIEDTTNDRKTPIVEDQLMVESIQNHIATPTINKHGIIELYVLQQNLPHEVISLDFKQDANQQSKTDNNGNIQYNIESTAKDINTEKIDVKMQDTLDQKLPLEMINQEFINVDQPSSAQNNQETVETHIQTQEDSESIQQKLPQEIINPEFKDHQSLRAQNIPPNLLDNTSTNQEIMPLNSHKKKSPQTEDTIPKPQGDMPSINQTQNMTPEIPETMSPNHQDTRPEIQENMPQKTTNNFLKRQKRFLSFFKRNEAQESDNFLFKMLEFLLKNRKAVVPVFTVMREINTLVKSNNGELNHMSKERNNYIGAPPPVLAPVTYNLELGNENRAMVFVKRLLGLTPKGDRLSITGTGK